ncbi:MAG: DegT/DnrJ/EryC1/StrS family aminotransferase [Thaumarchaeota archaeon]|nr:DegT/DnrJ/EryC1/StrS family aminotransferase [Nitrososphaerota archaeon]
MPVAEPDIGREELKNVQEAVRSGWVSSKGPFIGAFEEGFADYIGARHGVATSSGTTSLHLALRALGIGKGDKVLVPSLTFAATANAVLYLGAEPVFVDSHPQYWCMDPSKLESLIDNRTKAMIPVHLYGHPCDMKAILRVARDHRLKVVEDCAEAHGAEYKGRKVGCFGDISCFSFYGNKIITTGEGGMCLTSDRDLAAKMKVLRDHGVSPAKAYWHEEVGFNYRMTNLQAALGMAQLAKIKGLLKRKRRVASWYRSRLERVKGLSLHPEMPWASCVYWMYSVLVESKTFGIGRDALVAGLAERGIETRRFFYPIETMPPYRKFSHGRTTIARYLSERGMNLPSGAKLDSASVGKVSREIILLAKG